MKPGVYDDISNDEYHGGEGYSKSQLDLIARSPAHFKAAVDARAAGLAHAPTAAQSIGTAFHAAVLEPDLFSTTYCLGMRASDYPDAIDGRDALVSLVEKLNTGRLPKLSTSGSKSELVERIMTSDAGNENPITIEQLEPLKGAELTALIKEMNKAREGILSTNGTIAELCAILRENGRPVQMLSEIKEEWRRNNPNRIELSQEDWDTVRAMREAVFAHPTARALLRNGSAERSVYWKCPKTGLLLRCRPDWWTSTNWLVDLKSTDDASPREFARSVANWRYHVQDAMYTDGVELATGKRPRAFAFIACEKKPPYAVAVYVLGVPSSDCGRIEYQRNAQTLANCLESGKFPSFGDTALPLELPYWYLKEQGIELTQ